MPILTEQLRRQRLKEHGLILTTRYYDTAVRTHVSTDLVPCEVNDGVVLTKEYTDARNKLLLKETEFCPGIHYSYSMQLSGDGKVCCKNCGFTSDVEHFINGCEYCGSYLNINFEKALGEKTHANGYLLRRKKLLRKLPLYIIPAFAVGSLITYGAGRTHTIFDFLKGGFIGLFIGLCVFLIMYLSTNDHDTEGEQAKLARQQREMTAFLAYLAQGKMSSSQFYSELKKSVESRIFESDNSVVDMDILDYNDHAVADGLLSVTITMRVIRENIHHMTSRVEVYRATMRHNNNEGESGVHFISCPNCGASIDSTTMKCQYCGTVQKYTPPYSLVKLEKLARAE